MSDIITNMELWNKVCVTNPDNTKEVGFGRKFTAIDAHSQIKRATEVFGRVGVGWGWEVVEIQYPLNDTVALKIRVWHGDRDNWFEHWGQCGLFTGNDKAKDDQECFKKATTDGLTKCLSYLGFNADVFLGKFDDNKYVEALKETYEKREFSFTKENLDVFRKSISVCEPENFETFKAMYRAKLENMSPPHKAEVIAEIKKKETELTNDELDQQAKDRM